MLTHILTAMAQIRRDHLLHFFYGAVAALAILGATSLMGSARPNLAFGVVTLLAGLKELRDSTGRGHVEIADFLWSIAGATVPVVVSMAF